MGQTPDPDVTRPLGEEAPAHTPPRGLPPSGLPEGAQDVHALRAEIERTRTEIGETLQAIEERLMPSHLAARAAETARGRAARAMESAMSGATETANDLARHTRDAARGHPIPAALIGIALGYLVYRMATRSGATYESPESWGESEEDVDYGEYGWTSRRSSSVMATMRGNPLPAALIAVGLGWLVRNVRGGGAPRWPEPAGGETGHTEGEEHGWAGVNPGAWSGTAHEMAGAARQRMRQTGHQLSHRSGQVARMMREHPLPFGIAALAVGAAVGVSVPGTRTEDELLGSARDAMADRAREARDSVVERARAMAGGETGTGTETGSGTPPPA
jgi:hypothetical protein